MENPILVLVIILLLLVIIISCYCYAVFYNEIENDCKTYDCKTYDCKKPEIKLDDYKIALVANRGSDYLEVRAMNVIISNSQYYVYSNKQAYHVKQLEIDNRVSILIYTKQGESMKQVLLYGELEIINETKNLILYKLNIDHRKIAITVDTSETRSTSYSYDGMDQKELVTNFNEVNALIVKLNS